jgi:hypothetical protein
MDLKYAATRESKACASKLCGLESAMESWNGMEGEFILVAPGQFQVPRIALCLKNAGLLRLYN